MTTARTTQAKAAVPHRGRNALLTLAVPLMLQTVTTVVALSWRDDLPEQVATHWGTDGPDGFSSVVGSVATLGGTLVALALTFWAIGHFWGQASSTRRLAAGVSVGTAVFLGGIQLLTLAEQRGLEDAAQAGDVGFALGVSLIAAIAIGALVAWLLVPGDVMQAATAPVPATAPRLPLPEGERAVWIRQVTGRSGVWIMVVTTVLTGTMAVLTAQWWMLTIPAALAALGATMLVWTVRVDARGLDVRSAVGWPRIHVPATSVEGAKARQVHPLHEFGGWGWRTGVGGTIGIVMRKGEGIEVVHSGGKRLVVTVDDAETAAALLNTMADRAR